MLLESHGMVRGIVPKRFDVIDLVLHLSKLIRLGLFIRAAVNNLAGVIVDNSVNVVALLVYRGERLEEEAVAPAKDVIALIELLAFFQQRLPHFPVRRWALVKLLPIRNLLDQQRLGDRPVLIALYVRVQRYREVITLPREVAG